MNLTRKQAARAFGRALRTARRTQGLSQEDLAETGDFDRTYPSLLERGLRTPTFYVILQLARALHMDPRALFDDALAECREIGPAPESQAVSALSSGVFNTPPARKHASSLRESGSPSGDPAATGVTDQEATS
jgi:transcriptional regulator with XRE-family HTH domain